MNKDQMEVALQRIKERAVEDARRLVPPKSFKIDDIEEAIKHAVGQNVDLTLPESDELWITYTNEFNRTQVKLGMEVDEGWEKK